MNAMNAREALSLHLDHFDALYRADSDPWRAETCWQEHWKRRAVDRALGPGKFKSGLELACGNGASTAALARRFDRLIAVDGSPAAVAIASNRMAHVRNVSFACARLPEEFPERRYNAVIANELLYYMPENAAAALLGKVRASLRNRGMFITVNHARKFDDSEMSCSRLRLLTRRAFGPPKSTYIGPA
jgi:trans-aconitate methyltransferase